MNLEKINYDMYISVVVFCIIILLYIFVLFITNSFRDKYIKYLLIMIIITLLLLVITILFNVYLNYEDNKFFKNDLVFSTKIINYDDELITYPQKSILNLDKSINDQYETAQNILIEYNNLTNNYSFINKNKYMSKNFYISEEKDYNSISITHNDIFKKYDLEYKYYINSYGFLIDNEIYMVCRYKNFRWCIFKYVVSNNLQQYKPVCYLYKSFIYNNYRLFDIENDVLLCRLYSIGPEYIYEININKHYTIYGNYHLNKNNNEIINYVLNENDLNKKTLIKNYLSMLLPYTFTTLLKNTNYNNNFK